MSISNDLSELRRSSLVSTFGPGSVIDFRVEKGAVSGIAAGLEAWDHYFKPGGLSGYQITRETRLEKKLKVDGFRLPPVVLKRNEKLEPDKRRLIAVRFPKWLQCPICEYIKPERKWDNKFGKAYRTCAKCSAKLPGDEKSFVVPVRFVMACKSGHVDEFPWDLWVKHKKDCSVGDFENIDKHPGLRLRQEKPGLEGLILSCPKCKAKRSMDGVFATRGSKCRGLRPWLPDGKEECKKEQYVVQRGASNLYFPVIESALSIPPWSDSLQDELGSHWNSFKNLEDRSQLESYVDIMVLGDLKHVIKVMGLTPAELAKEIRMRLESFDQVETDDLRPQEYNQFVKDYKKNRKLRDEFETRRENVPDEISPWVSRVVRAVRLREVRAIRGFTRIDPPSSPTSDEVAPLSKVSLGWLPAIEVRGEGIFIELHPDRVVEWEERRDVIERVKICDERYREDHKIDNVDIEGSDWMVSPRYMLCHTLAHVLMRQLTLECGYSAAELNERVYAGVGEYKMAGVLIYTATTDSDGTLGGLERQGKTERIREIMYNAIKSVEWCSSDPLCITDAMNAINSYSRSVCHACCLAPETACETFNRFLDRGLLIGDGSGSGLGFFENMNSVPFKTRRA